MKQRRWILLFLVVLAVAAALWGLAFRRKERPLLLSGTIEARDVEVGSLLGGRIQKVLVDEGSAVSAGQPIVQFETDLIDLQIQQQKSRVEEIRAQGESRVGIERLEVELAIVCCSFEK